MARASRRRGGPMLGPRWAWAVLLVVGTALGVAIGGLPTSHHEPVLHPPPHVAVTATTVR